jgi:hypothetical protein
LDQKPLLACIIPQNIWAKIFSLDYVVLKSCAGCRARVVKLVETAVVWHQGQHDLIVVRPLAVLDPAPENQAPK